MAGQSRSHFRFSLRRKLLLLSIVVVTLPFVGLEYLREMERYLRSSLEDSLLNAAHATAGSLHDRATLFPENPAETPALYIHRLRQPVQLDGYSNDWLDFLDWSQPYQIPDNPASLSYRLILAENDTDLYALIKVRDDRVIYQRPDSRDNRDGDHVQMTARMPDGGLRQLYFAPSAPGTLRPFMVEIVRDEYDFAHEIQRYATNITAEWQNDPNGYTLEIRLPRDYYQSLGFTVHDMDNPETRTLANSLGTAGTATAREPNGLLTSSSAIEQLIELQRNVSGRRIWVLNEYGQVLASDGDLERELETAGGQFIYNLLLPPPPRYFEDDLAGASRLRGNEVQAALAGSSHTRWRASPDGRAVIASAAAPVMIDGAVRGAVVVEETTHQIQMLQRAAFASLVNKTLLTYGLVTILLLLFATRLSLRLRNLSRQAEAAIDEHGRVVDYMEPSQAHDEIGELSRGYAAMLERLQRYNNYLEGMAGRLAHELRTPLTVVQSSLENLEGSSADEREMFIQRARDGIRRLNHLVTRLSETARLEHSLQLAEVESIDIVDMLAVCVENYRLAYPQRQFVYQHGESALYIEVAPDLIAQLLDKLVANANDFAEPATPITLQLSCDRQNITLSVINQGPLLPADISERLFDSLVSQRDKSQKEEPHLGLGLYLARLIADYHNGRLVAENLEDGSGVRFSLILPRQ